MIHRSRDRSPLRHDRSPLVLRRDRSPLDNKAERMLRRARDLRGHYSSDDDIPDDAGEGKRERSQRKYRRREAILQPKIPEVNKVNFEHFKNRYGVSEPGYAIDVLVGGRNLEPQIQRELDLRNKRTAYLRRRRMFGPYHTTSTQPTGSGSAHQRNARHDSVHHDKPRREETSSANKPEAVHIHRVRIQSRPILAYLTRLLKAAEKRSWPRTFFRPFRPLVYFQPQMRKALEDLEQRLQSFEEAPVFDDKAHHEEALWTSKVPGSAEGRASEATEQDSKGSLADDSNEDDDDFIIDYDMASDFTDDESLDEIMQTPEALRDMRCYVEFVDRDIMPLYDQFDNGGSQKVTFEDLWSLFRVGELVYLPPAGKISERYHQLWRVYHVQSAPSRYDFYKTRTGHLSFRESDLDEERDEFTLSCYYINHDGSSYGAVCDKLVIQPFLGERDIHSLEVFPLRFYSDRESLIERLRDQGHSFQRCLEQRYQAYNGWTFPDEEIYRRDGKMKHPEFVESHVIVDLEEAFQSYPYWRPQFNQPSASLMIRSDIGDDMLPIQHWASRSRTQLLYSIKEAIQVEDGIEMRQRKDGILTDTFLQRCAKESRAKVASQTGPMSLDENDLVLLPNRIFAYVLRERRFVPIDLNYLKPIAQVPNVFDNLKIPEMYKKVLRGLVNSHFYKRDLERNLVDNRSTEGLSQDLIQGKGRGLVVLLHGVPGVGKTATAEAIAIENKKPLFVITCGDLGLTAEEVEERLGDVFRLAHLWDCVLLLDEADVFLSQRSRSDMKRNALVSVFLRVLEYYHGLLFLTTNRVGTLDEAFKSRIHISLYYPMLNRTQTEAIFRVNVDKLRDMGEQRAMILHQPALEIHEEEILEFASNHFDATATTGANWNGRQIRNAFQIAAGIAYYNYAHEVESARAGGHREPYSPVLGRKAFEEVQEVTQNFEDHLRETKGWADADLAYLIAERADHMTNIKQGGGIQTAKSYEATTAAPLGASQFPGMYPRSIGQGADKYDDSRARYGAGAGTHEDRRHGYGPSSEGLNIYGSGQTPERIPSRGGLDQVGEESPKFQPPSSNDGSSKDQQIPRD